MRYIGKGTGSRYKTKSNRRIVHLDELDNLNKKILINNLSSDTARSFEHKLINDAISLGKNLFNKVTAESKVIDINCVEMSKFFEYSENSPSGLVAKTNRRVLRWEILSGA